MNIKKLVICSTFFLTACASTPDNLSGVDIQAPDRLNTGLLPENTVNLGSTPFSPDFSFITRLRNPVAMGITENNATPSLVPTSIVNAEDYQSPYTLKFDFAWEDLVTGFDKPPFNKWSMQADKRYFKNPKRWYNYSVYQNIPKGARAGSIQWGPEANQFPVPVAPEAARENISNWMRQRLVAVAASMIGYGYRHHHIPDWNPKQSWYDEAPEKPEFIVGDLIGQGLDCSDYTAWLYNFGLGISLNTAIEKQATMKMAQDLLGKSYQVQRVADATDSLEILQNKLQTGDLLFIAGSPELSKADIQNQLTRPKQLKITHVVMWLGSTGVSPNNVPLITDSHGAEILDSNQKAIPAGIQVRPFNNATQDITTPVNESSQSWYFDHFAWALRVIPSQ
jgi:cell wall-associated NlpC family hydrolase